LVRVTSFSAPLDVTAGGRPVLVMCPDADPGRGSVEMLATLARARARAAAACFVPPPGDAGALVSLAASRDVPVVEAGGWLRARWALADGARRARTRWRTAVASGLQEAYRELRRQAGNERLPAEFRRRLRASAHRAYDRSVASTLAAAPFPRRLLREPSAFTLPSAALDAARAQAATLGFEAGPPTVTLEAGLRPDLVAAIRRSLGGRGYRVIELHAPSLPLTLFLLCASRFVICTSREVQQLSYLTNTPALAVNATDVFAAYPVRADGLVLLRTPIDLETGQVMPLASLLREGYAGNERQVGFREHAMGELTAAVEEMLAGVDHGWQESPSQARFREQAVAAGIALAPLVPSVAEWGPEDGFLGDGRLARVQADIAGLRLEP
jgi:hypothetical protein